MGPEMKAFSMKSYNLNLNWKSLYAGVGVGREEVKNYTVEDLEMLQCLYHMDMLYINGGRKGKLVDKRSFMKSSGVSKRGDEVFLNITLFE